MGLFNQRVAGSWILSASNDLTSWPKQETGTPQETILARVYLMTQSVLLSDGGFLHGGSYFNCRIIIWEAAKGWMLPPSAPAQATSVMFLSYVLLSKAKLLAHHQTYLVMVLGMDPPCRCPPDCWDCELGCSSPALCCAFSSLLGPGKGSHLPGICVCSFSHEQPEEEMRNTACSWIRNKFCLKADLNRWSIWVHLFWWWFS